MKKEIIINLYQEFQKKEIIINLYQEFQYLIKRKFKILYYTNFIQSNN